MRAISPIVLFLAASLASCSIRPTISIATRQGDNSFDFEFSTQDIAGLMELRMWQADTKELLWDVNLDYYKDPRLTYGYVPANFLTYNGRRNDAQQNFPRNSRRPRPLAAGKRFFVSIDCLHGAFMGEEVEPFYFSFSTDADGRVLAASPVEGMKSDDLAKTPDPNE